MMTPLPVQPPIVRRSFLVILAALAIGITLNPMQCANAQDGEALYQQHCAQCHGAQLQGGNAQSLVDGVWQYGVDRNYVNMNIKFGLPHLGMPAFGEALSNGEIRQVVDFLKASEGQAGATRPPPPATYQTLDYEVALDVLVKEGMQRPWAIAFPDATQALVTEQPGRLRLMEDGVLHPKPITGTPTVLFQGQGGLLDVAVDPDYASNGWVYLAYSDALEVPGARRPPAMTKIVRGHIKDHRWVDEQVVFQAAQDSYRQTRHHYGSRIVFDPAGNLYFSIGERGIDREAQDLGLPNGKIHRIRRDGEVPPDNPFVGRAGALPTIYTYGNRNPQGLAVHPDSGRVWSTEHGPMGGDELNLLAPGTNYGWPVITYGINYNGRIISNLTRRDGMEQPVIYWRPSLAVCGLDFYRGDAFPKWRHHLLVGALKYEELRLVSIHGDRVLHQEVILKGIGRVRDVSTGPDGFIYVVLNNPDMVVRLRPAG